MRALEGVHEAHQGLYARHGHCVVETGAHASHRTVAFERDELVSYLESLAPALLAAQD